VKNALKSYFKNRSLGWWFSTILLVVILTILAVPQWRFSVSTWINELRLSAPNIKTDHQQLPKEAYNLSYKDMSGEKHFLANQKGKVVFINFWGTWCPPCVSEMPSIERLYHEFKDDVTFIIYSREKKKVIEAFAERKNLKLPFVNTLYEIPQFFTQFNSLPSTFVLSKSGDIRISESGAAKWDADNVRVLLKELIAE